MASEPVGLQARAPVGANRGILYRQVPENRKPPEPEGPSGLQAGHYAFSVERVKGPFLFDDQAARCTTSAMLSSRPPGLARTSIAITTRHSQRPPSANPPSTSLSQCAPR